MIIIIIIKGGWDVDDLNDNRDVDAPTLLNICAINGNAEAVALLIQHGADLAKGVLHEIVIESVCYLYTRYVTYYRNVYRHTRGCSLHPKKCQGQK